MGDAERIVIVGASLAGARAAEGARDAGFEGEILLIGDEPTGVRSPRCLLDGLVNRQTARMQPRHLGDDGAQCLTECHQLFT